MKHNRKIASRRDFLKRSAAAGALTFTGCGLFNVVPRHVLGGSGHTPPSETVYVASIGAGGRAAWNIGQCRMAGGRIVALCDVDDEQSADMYKRSPDAVKYRDFRRMLDKEKGLDAVIVATPDHTHAVAAVAAMERGKHVYCEKPLAHSLHEVRRVTEAARKYKVATQLGNQGHSTRHIRLFCEWIQDGAIGDVTEVHAVYSGSYSRIGHLDKLDEYHRVPSTLDWDLWLGPAPYRPFNPMYVPGSWRGWSQFGTGAIGDWACHVLDPVFWALDLKHPISVEADVGDYDPEKHGETFPQRSTIRFGFPARGDKPPVTVIWYEGGPQPPRPPELEEGRSLPEIGAVVVGDKGKIVYGSHGAESCRLIPESKMKAYQRPPKTIPRSPGHHAEWLEACKGGPPAGSNFDYGGPLTETALLGNVAVRMKGEKLIWDGPNLTFTNEDKANEFIHGFYRHAWAL